MRSTIVVCIVVALSLAIPSIEGNVNNLRLSNSHLSVDTYKRFIKNLRQSLYWVAFSEDNIPFMRPSAPDSNRFYSFDLTSAYDETITVAIDVLDARIAAYCAGSKSYFFSNAPRIASRILFTNTTQSTMDFDNTFPSLEKVAGITRSQLPLGKASYDSAITSLFHHELVPESFLVILQMVIEASKFRFIQQHVVNNLRDEELFLPTLAILSLEDNWSQLCFQRDRSLQGVFNKEVLLYNSNDEPIKVDSIYYPIEHANIAYLLFNPTQDQDSNNNIIKMPGSVKDDHTRQKNKYKIEPKPVRISGRDGMCVDVAGALVADGSRVILYPCGEQENQKWSFYPDFTIRSLGKCLAGSNTGEPGSPVVIYDCDKASRRNLVWKVYTSGWIVRSYFDVSLTANSRAISTNLTEEYNAPTADQTWRLGNHVKPFIVSIVGLDDMCLGATNANTEIMLEDCVKNKKEQSWALYSDGTIRVSQNRSLCVISTSRDGSSKAVKIDTCIGSSNERWHFSRGRIANADGYSFFMDVEENDGYLKKIIINHPNDEDSQQWVVLY